MTYAQVLIHFKTASAVAEFLGITTGAVAHWKRRGGVPIRMQYVLEVRTHGRLRADVAQQVTQPQKKARRRA